MNYIARIYRPTKNAMQSGQRELRWLLKMLPDQDTLFIDPLMGWTGSTDTVQSQLVLWFDSQKDAVAYAEEREIPYEIWDNPDVHNRKLVPKSYASNFRHDRIKAY